MAMAAVEKIISEINGLNEKDRIALLEKIDKLYSREDNPMEDDKPLQAVFGLWKDYDIDKTKLREMSWRKN